MLKLHRTGPVGQLDGIGGIGQNRRFINKIKHTLGTGQCVLELGHHVRNIVERLGVLVGVVQKYRQIADRNAARDSRKRTQYADCRIHQRIDKARAGVGH